jgi:hypothetical protein
MRNTVDLTSDKPIAIWSQYILDESPVNPSVTFYDIPGRKGAIILLRPGHQIRSWYIYFFNYEWKFSLLEELDGRVVSALGVRSRKLSTGLNGQS